MGKSEAINRKLRKVYQQIDEEKRDQPCEGCGNRRWTEHSHRIPRWKRPDLICEPDNIDNFCRECHLLHEAGKWDQLNNGEEIIQYLLDNEPSQYWTYYHKNNPINVEHSNRPRAYQTDEAF